MPQQLLVMNVFGVPLSLTFFVQLKYLLDFKFEAIVSGSMGIGHIFLDHFELRRVPVKRSDIGVEFEVVGIQLIHVTANLPFIQQFREDLNIFQGLQHLQLILDLCLSVQNEIRHLLETEIVRDVREEIVTPINEDIMSLGTLHFLHQHLQCIVSFHDT